MIATIVDEQGNICARTNLTGTKWMMIDNGVANDETTKFIGLRDITPGKLFIVVNNDLGNIILKGEIYIKEGNIWGKGVTLCYDPGAIEMTFNVKKVEKINE